MNNNNTKPLKFGFLLALVVGNMVGSGIFLLPASMANLGSSSLLSWLFTVAGSFLLAITLSKSSQLVRRNGGPYAFAKSGFGNFVGFQTAYCHWVSMWVINTSLILAMVSYLAVVLPGLANPLIAAITAIATIWLITIINISGIKPMAWVQTFTAILKLLPIILIIIFGAKYFHLNYLLSDFQNASFNINYLNFSTAAGLTLWSFIGIESASIPYDHIENPERNIPLATLLGTVIAALIYILSSSMIMGMIPAAALVNSASPFFLAANVIFGAAGKWIMAAGAIISCFGCANGWTFLQGQVAMSAADDGLFPQIFSWRNKAGLPSWGLSVTASAISILILLIILVDIDRKLEFIMTMASFAALIPYLYSSVAEMIMLKQGGDNIGFIKRQLYFLAGFFASIYAFWALFSIGERALAYGMLLFFSSILLYAWDRR